MLTTLAVAACLALNPTQGVRMERSFKEGQTLKYVITRSAEDQGNIRMGGGGGTWNVEMNVQSVKDGVTVIKFTRTVEKLDMEEEGMVPEDIIKQMKEPVEAILTIGKDGEYDFKPAEKKGGRHMMMGADDWYRDVIFTAQSAAEVKLGEQWKVKLPARKTETVKGQPPFERGELTSECKLEGEETVEGISCHKVTVATKGVSKGYATMRTSHGDDGESGESKDGIAITIHSSTKYTVLVAKDDGRVVKRVGTEETAMEAPDAPMPMDHTTTMRVEVRLKK